MRILVIAFIMLLAKIACAQHAANLSWVQGTANAGCTTDCPITSNNVYRSLDNISFSLLFGSVSPITSYRDSPLIGGKTYYYKITAVATCNGNADCGGVNGATAESVFSSTVIANIPTAKNKLMKYRMLGIN